MTPLLAAIAIFLTAMILLALFEGYETGFVSLNAIRVRALADEDNDPRARRVLPYLDNPRTLLTTLLLGTNLAIVAGSMALAVELARWGVPDRYIEIVAAAIAAPLFLVFSQIIPKSVFRAHPNRFVPAFLPFIELFHGALWLIQRPICLLTQRMLRAVGAAEESMSPLMSSREGVRVLVDESADHGALHPDEQRMIHSVIDMPSIHAQEIMVPRIDIQALPDTAPRDELLTLFVASGMTRVPIYSDSIDQIVGVVNAHDFLLDDQPDNPDIRRLMRDVLHVPDTIKLDDLFAEMKRAKQHMAIVVDEYGGTDGLVTIEDILEQIFGEIQDEHDREEKAIVQVGPRAYVIDARTSLDEVSRAVGRDIDDDQVDTIGGLAMRFAGRILSQGEVTEHHGLRLTVLEGAANQISRVRLEITDDAPQDQDGQKED